MILIKNRYYESIGAPQDMSLVEEVPTDNFSETSKGKKKTKARPERTNEKIYNEVMLNGGHINQNMQQFMEKDRCVARFFAIVDDLITPQFERRPFIIMYWHINSKCKGYQQKKNLGN